MSPSLNPEKNAAILTGAMQQFLEHGYAATSMARVAAAANVSKATVYSHFQDKESLFKALIRQLAEKKFTPVMTLNESTHQERPVEAVLSQVANYVLDQAIQDPQFQDFMRLILGESGRFPQLAQLYVDNMARPLLSNVTRYFASQPSLNHPDPEALARVFVGTLVYYIMLQEVMHGQANMPMERERMVNTLIGLIVPAMP